MPRSRSEKEPSGTEIFNRAQREHMRNEARWVVGLDLKSVHSASWDLLSRHDQKHLFGKNFRASMRLRIHYAAELRREQNGT